MVLNLLISLSLEPKVFTRYLPVIVVFCIVTPVGGLEVAITGICISFPAADTAVPTGMRRFLLGA